VCSSDLSNQGTGIGGNQALRFAQHQLPHGSPALASRHRIHSGLHQRIEIVQCTDQTQIGGRTGAAMVGILSGRFAQLVGLHHHVADIVCDLVSLAQGVAEFAPRCRIDTCSQSASASSSDKQGTGFGALVLAELHTRFAFPSLAGNDAVGSAHTVADDAEQLHGPHRVHAPAVGQRLLSHDDQSIAGEQRQRFAKLFVNGDLAAA